jgi:hypothetical protein
MMDMDWITLNKHCSAAWTHIQNCTELVQLSRLLKNKIQYLVEYLNIYINIIVLTIYVYTNIYSEQLYNNKS